MRHRPFLPFSFRLCLALFLLAAAQPADIAAQESTKAKISRITIAGNNSISAEVIMSAAGLEPGDLAGRDDLQAAADRMAQLGLFSKVSYDFRNLADGLTVTFHVEEAPRIPVFFDNVPWFTDGELGDAIRKTVPYFDGTAPEGGSVLDRIAEALQAFLGSHGQRITVEHQLIGNPLGDGMVQEYRINGTALKISRIEFSDSLATSSHALQQNVSELLGKPFSRLMIDLFLAEQVQPLYLQRGYLRVKLGPPDVRLTGSPNQPLPESVPVFVPVTPGALYHWQGAQWTGNAALPVTTLNSRLSLIRGDLADQFAIEGAWDRIREEYGHLGYLDARVEPQPVYDDQAHTISYRVAIAEGASYRYGDMIVTGVSLAAEKRIRASWTIPGGEIFDKLHFEGFLVKLQQHSAEIFGDLPLHYDAVGHWLRTDAAKGTVDVLLDFK